MAFRTFLLATMAVAASGQTWQIDSIDRIAGHPATVRGKPKTIATPYGPAVEFNGVDDALFLDVHPLAGAETWTWEVLFRPDMGGAPEQRFFHLQENGTDHRMLFEIRVIGNEWCLDSFAKGGSESLALLDRTKLHPLGAWYYAEAVYDGHELRSYVDGVPEGKGNLHLEPQGAGKTSLGARINRVYYFKGAIARARMTPRALPAAEFLKK